MEIVKRIHLASLMDFAAAIFCAWYAIAHGSIAAGLCAAGFLCFGIYTYIKVPADAFFHDFAFLSSVTRIARHPREISKFEIFGSILLGFGLVLAFP